MRLFKVTLVMPLRKHDKDQHYVEICAVLASDEADAIRAAYEARAAAEPLCAQARDLDGERVVHCGFMHRSAVIVGGMIADPAWTKFADGI